MKSLLFLIIGLLFSPLILANTQCIPPTAGTVIYFGNGINTSMISAKASLDRLTKELGNDNNGEELKYSLAYNETEGMALDLVQASEQQAIQIDSRLMLWLNGIGLAPDWFSIWYQSYLARRTVVVAEEVVNHANYYLNDILEGKKVVVVSHSQGNFYVNEAKQLLARQLSGDKMSSFAIFGVAVPSDNIGGGRTPYLTNHRDFIQNVPLSMPTNWKLHRSDRTDAEDVGPIQAHLFNATYISADFDIRPALIAGINTQLDSTVRPSHNCQTYNSLVSSLASGRYLVTCGMAPNPVAKPFLISPSDMTLPDGSVVGTTSVETFLSFGKKRDSPQAQFSFGALGGMEGDAVSAEWGSDRVFHWFISRSMCYVDRDTPPSSIGKISSIAGTMMSAVPKIYRFLPKGSCQLGMVSYNDKPIEFFMDGAKIQLGERSWQIGGDAESVSTANYGFKSQFKAPYTDPGFLLFAEFGNAYISMTITRNREIIEFTAVDINEAVVRCSFDQRSQSL